MYMAPRYKITLTLDERERLLKMTSDGKTPSKKYQYARALLLCDTSQQDPCWKVAEVATALGISSRTIEHLKERFVEEGLDAALQRRSSRIGSKPLFDGAFDARMTALACSPAPQGYARWTLRLLADKVVELNIASSVSVMTIHRSLKKTNYALT